MMFYLPWHGRPLRLPRVPHGELPGICYARMNAPALHATRTPSPRVDGRGTRQPPTTLPGDVPIPVYAHDACYRVDIRAGEHRSWTAEERHEDVALFLRRARGNAVACCRTGRGHASMSPTFCIRLPCQRRGSTCPAAHPQRHDVLYLALQRQTPTSSRTIPTPHRRYRT